MAKTSQPKPSEVEAVQAELKALQEQLVHIQESERRAQADYQNLLRRTQAERAQLISFAERGLLEDLLQPIEHLDMAAQQLGDSGLNMALDQLWKALKHHGFEQLQVMGKPYTVEEMEAVEIEPGVKEETAVVVRVVKQGYRLNGTILQHAKVILGDAKQS